MCIIGNNFPQWFKYGKVEQIHKKGIKTEQNNYRPVSIIPIVSKLSDYLINKQTVNSLELNWIEIWI